LLINHKSWQNKSIFNIQSSIIFVPLQPLYAPEGAMGAGTGADSYDY
jgi:hypothetical protein